jgi:hypothetical protein
MKKIFIAAMALYFTACSMPSMPIQSIPKGTEKPVVIIIGDTVVTVPPAAIKQLSERYKVF